MFYVGQVIGAIVAVNQEVAQAATRLVRVEYQDLPAVITIEEAIAAGSYHHWDNNVIVNGDVEEAIRQADHVVEGSVKTGAQEHFYLETQVPPSQIPYCDCAIIKYALCY